MKDLTTLIEWAFFIKTGRTARDFGDHTLLALEALLFYREEASRELMHVPRPHWLERPSYREQGREQRTTTKPQRTPVRWEEPVLTGDPVTDAWERAIARGETPDLGTPFEPVTHA